MHAHPSNLAPLPIALPLLGAALIAATRKWLTRAATDTLGILVAAVTLATMISLLIQSTHATEVYWFGNWYPRGSVVIGTSEADHRIYGYHIAPPIFLLIMAISLTFVGRWLPILSDAAVTIAPQAIGQAAYLHVVYTGDTVYLTQPTWHQALPSAALRGTISLALAWLLACSSVFRLRIKWWFRFGPRLEGDQRLLRALQSGHPGDYVLYLTAGLALFGSAAMVLLRS